MLATRVGEGVNNIAGRRDFMIARGDTVVGRGAGIMTGQGGDTMTGRGDKNMADRGYSGRTLEPWTAGLDNPRAADLEDDRTPEKKKMINDILTKMPADS